jgi:hypothetical protein
MARSAAEVVNSFQPRVSGEESGASSSSSSSSSSLLIEDWDGLGIPKLPDFCSGDTLHDFLKEGISLSLDSTRPKKVWDDLLEFHGKTLFSMINPPDWRVRVEKDKTEKTPNYVAFQVSDSCEIFSTLIRFSRPQMEYLDHHLEQYAYSGFGVSSMPPMGFSFSTWWDRSRLDALAIKVAQPGASLKWVTAFQDHLDQVLEKTQGVNPTLTASISEWWPGWKNQGPMPSSCPGKSSDRPSDGIACGWLLALSRASYSDIRRIAEFVQPRHPEVAAAISAWWVLRRANLRLSYNSPPDDVKRIFSGMLHGSDLWLKMGAHPDISSLVLSNILNFVQGSDRQVSESFWSPSEATKSIMGLREIWLKHEPSMWSHQLTRRLAGGSDTLARLLDTTVQRPFSISRSEIQGLAVLLASDSNSAWSEILLGLREDILQSDVDKKVKILLDEDPLWNTLSDRRCLDLVGISSSVSIASSEVLVDLPGTSSPRPPGSSRRKI